MSHLTIIHGAAEHAGLGLKVGGVADVIDALSRTQRGTGHDVSCILPRYFNLDRERHATTTHPGALIVPFGEPQPRFAEVVTAHAGEVPVHLINYDILYGRDGIYGPRGKGSYPDNIERFLFYAKASLLAMMKLGIRPNVLHAHDWHAAAMFLLLDTVFRGEEWFKDTARVQTIHNLAYQGVCGIDALRILGIDLEHVSPKDIEDNDVRILKSGIVHADMTGTVSPQYAQEICTPQFGEGLHELLARVQPVGILNAVDNRIWNPETDTVIQANFGAESIAGRAVCRESLLAELDLDNTQGPFFGHIGRLAGQKGTDLLIASLPHFIEHRGARVVVLGNGQPEIERQLHELQNAFPNRVRFVPGHHENLAHRIYAGTDFFLMPSRHEPCGLGQMYALRYGSVPIVHSTGGLADTIRDRTGSTNGNGFVFREPTAEALGGALNRALELWEQQPEQFVALQIHGMHERFDWNTTAEHYDALYDAAIQARRRKNSV